MSETPSQITYADFKKLQLLVGTVLSVDVHPNADKLFVVKVALGGDVTRQIVSGIREFYLPEQLIGRNVIIVANLEPKVIRGTESHGMLLAAQDSDGKVVVLSPEKRVAPGSPVS